jgi:uncharacterized protein YjbJ (UPF0337 family)
MSFWPLYRESILQGPSHVSLALPGIKSKISKSIGVDAETLLLVPNTDFLTKFIKGDVGISDKFVKSFIQSQINSLATLLPTVPPIPPIPKVPPIEIPKPPKIPTDQLNGLTNQITDTTGQITGQISNATGQITNATGQITGQISNATGQIGAAAGQITGQITGQISNATNQLGNATSQLSNNLSDKQKTTNQILNGEVPKNVPTTGLAGKLVDKTKSTANDLLGKANTLKDTGVDSAGNLLNKTNELAGSAGNLLGKTTGMANNLTGKANELAGSAGNLLGKTTTKADELAAKANKLKSDINLNADRLTKIPTPDLSKFEKFDEKIIKKMGEAFNMELPDIGKYRDASGKIRIPLPEVKIPYVFEDLGLKSVEKTILQSIFETQKPYVEIVKSILNSIVSIEDVIARVMPILATNPLTSKSEKPMVKDGNSNGTKAIGFKGGLEFKKALSELQKISKEGLGIDVDKEGNATVSPKRKKVLDVTSKLSDLVANWNINSVRYSTGNFDPTVEYKYEYIYLPTEGESPTEPLQEDEEPVSPYDKYKPKKIILGIFKSDGSPLNPREKLKTISTNGVLSQSTTTPFEVADWIYKSSKWRFSGNDYIWPTLGDPIYVWEGPFGITTQSKTKPGDNYSIKRYKKGDKNIINTDIDALEGDPIITRFEGTDTTEFLKYFTEYIKSKTKNKKDLTDKEKSDLLSDIMSKLDVQSHLQNVFLYGSCKNSVYKKPGIPAAMKRSFMPFKVHNPDAKSDPDLEGDGMIWVDPESDYDLKIMRIDPSTLVNYIDAKGTPILSSNIKSFVKNIVVINLNNKEKFDIEVTKNGSTIANVKGVTEYSIENWNFENGSVNSTNKYEIKISSLEKKFTKVLGVDNLPDFGVSKTLTVNMNTETIKSSEKTIPLYSLKVTSSNSENGVVIYPDSIDNSALSTEDLLSKGRYGNGTPDDPMDLEILKRFSKTDLDTESYYVIEGFLIGEKKDADASGDNGSKWYRLPHAIGAFIPFLKFLIELGTKLFPNISKFLKLVKDPVSFIIDIVKEKLGEAFSILSEKAFEKFKSTKEIIDKKVDTLKKDMGNSEYVSKVKRNFNTSPLVNHVYVDRFNIKNPGEFKFLFDGVAMVPFEIFGKSIPFGVEFKMSNLIPKIPEVKVPDLPKVDIPKVDISKINIPDVKLSANVSLDKNGGINASVNGLPKSLPKMPDLPNIAIPNIGIPNITLPKVSSPFRLIKGKIGKAKFKGCGKTDVETKEKGLSNDDYLKELTNGSKVETQPTKKTTNSNTYQVSTIWYSTGQFVKGTDYTYTYITEDQAVALKEVDELINPGSTSTLIAPDSKIIPEKKDVSDEDVMLAKEKVENELKKDPDNEALRNKLKQIMDIIQKRLMNSQPVLKFVLGMVSSPLKIITCIVEWILDFFKSLTNPMTLPSKIIEFLSFKWIMKFFSPEGLLGAFGIKFDPSIAKEWATLSSMPNLNLPCVGGIPTGGLDIKIPKPEIKLPNVTMPKVGDLITVTGSVAADLVGDKVKIDIPKVDLKTPDINLKKSDIKIDIKPPEIKMNGGFPINKSNLLKNIKPHCGKFALPDNFPLADINKLISIAFLPSLPTYSSYDIRMNPLLPFDFLKPPLCLIEKLINAFIDFVWALLGIEVIIPAPHIKLCKEKSAAEKNRVSDGSLESDESDEGDVTEVTSTNPLAIQDAKNLFVYEVTLENGEKKVITDYAELKDFMSDNKDLYFDLQF